MILKLDGTLENKAPEPTGEMDPLKAYPPSYRLPVEILDYQTTTQDKVFRMESFALGGIIYEIVLGKEAFCFTENSGINQTQSTEGMFPADVYQHTMAERMLVAWCPHIVQVLSSSKFFLPVSFGQQIFTDNQL